MGKINFLKKKIKNYIYILKKCKNIFFVIKELIKNSLDAKSKNIYIYFKKYGLENIKIIDDGIGMSLKDLLICYKQYSTSKIKNIKDLKKKKFYGYKGDSLFWISYISNFSIFTKKKNSKLGKKIYIEYGKFLKKEILFKINKGTTINLNNLFFNIPFIKKNIKINFSFFKNMIYQIIILLLPYNKKIVIYNNDKLILNYKFNKDFKKNICYFFKKKNINFLKFKNKKINIKLFYFTSKKKNIFNIYLNNKIIINNNINKFLKKIFKKFYLYKKNFFFLFISFYKNINYFKFKNLIFLKKNIFKYIKNIFYKKYIFLRNKKNILLCNKNINIKIKYLYELYNKYLLYIYNNNLYIIIKELSIKNIILNIIKYNKKFIKKKNIYIKYLNIKYLYINKKYILLYGIKFIIINKIIKVIKYPKIFKKKYIIYFFNKFNKLNYKIKNIYYYIYNFIYKNIKKYYLNNKKKIFKHLLISKLYIKNINLFIKINNNYINKIFN
ncbi:MAG: ATP-binding protein [Candidatus Shikimatogenerans sp. Tmey]